jgi:hypothetical protein
MIDSRIHPGEDLLLRFGDGELRARDSARIASHVQACWKCRTRLEDLKKTIGDYVHYRTDVLLPGLPPPPEPWQGLEPAFERLRREESSRRRGWHWRRGPAGWLLAGATAVLAAGIGRMIVVSQASHVAPERNETRKPDPVAEHASNVVSQKIPPAQADRTPQTLAVVGPEDELKVFAVLHRVGADLGDPVDVQRKPDQILVTAAGLEPERLEAIRSALAGLSRVSLETPTQTPLHTNQSSPDAIASSEPSLLQTQLSPEEFQQVSNTLLEASEGMMARAFALRRLADHFPPELEMQLSQPGQEELWAIRNQHAAAFSEQIAKIGRSLSPWSIVIKNRARPSNPAETRQNWQTLSQALFARATRTDRLLATILVGPKSAGRGDSDLAELAGLISELERDVSGYRSAR